MASRVAAAAQGLNPTARYGVAGAFCLYQEMLDVCGVLDWMAGWIGLTYRTNFLPKASIAAGLCIAVATGVIGYRAKQRDADPVWFNFATIAFFIAAIAAGVLGDLNYWCAPCLLV